MITIKILYLKRKITPAACTIMDFERVPLHGNGIDCGSCHWISNECELNLKWITMPENLASNSANLQPVGMHVMHDVHNNYYVSDCAVVGVPLSDTDSDTRQSLSQSHRTVGTDTGHDGCCNASTGNSKLIRARSLFTAISIYGA